MSFILMELAESIFGNDEELLELVSNKHIFTKCSIQT